MTGAAEHPRDPAWRSHLDHALPRADHTLVLADMDATGSMAMQVRCDRPRDLLDLARALLDQAVDRLQDMEGAEAEELEGFAGDALACLPDPHDRDAENAAP